MPKTPDELREQIEDAQDVEGEPGTERTAEGLEVTTPTRKDFFGNLTKVTEPEE